MSNIRDTYKLQIVEVLEGNGTEDAPYTEVRYVIKDDTVIGYIHEMPFKYFTPSKDI